MFGSKPNAALKAREAELLDSIQSLEAEIRGLRAERGDLKTRDQLISKNEQLQRDLIQKKIEYDREHEKWEKEKREVEHSVGLQRKTAEFEKNSAEQEAIFRVREENLQAKEDEFARQMEFNNERYEKTETYLRDMFDKVMDRLPDVNVAINGTGSAKK